MKKKSKNKDFWLIIIAVLLIIAMYIMWQTSSSDCYKTEIVCYKTECSFWGCGHIQVDIDSPQCELKKTECVSGNLKAQLGG